MSNTTTSPESVLPAPEAIGPERRRRWPWWVAGSALVLVVAVVLAGLFVRVPYYTLSPGSVWPTDALIEVDGVQTYDDAGDIAFTTVSLKQASAAEALVGWLNPDISLVHRDLILGGQTEDENRERNRRAMLSSQETATVVALEHLGYDVVTPIGAEIIRVDEDRAATGLLEEGDVVLELDGVAVEEWQEVVDLVGRHRPGTEIELVVERGGSAETVTIELGARDDDPERPLLGVVGRTMLEVDLPFEITIDAGDVGGPSAGLAFTLALLDLLTPGDLTGGAAVATTGTIAHDGSVGAVGGVPQKVVAARRGGVELFLVPASLPEDDLAQVHERAGSMRVVEVETLEDALAALEAVGGSALALGSAGVGTGDEGGG